MFSRVLLFSIAVCLGSCQADSRGLSESLLPPMDTIIDYHKLDELPLFVSCGELTTKFDRELCTRDSLYVKIAVPLLSETFYSSQSMNSSIQVRLLVSKKGEMSLHEVQPQNALDSLPNFKKSLEKVLKGIEPLKPAIKNGQAVKVIYNLPIDFIMESS